MAFVEREFTTYKPICYLFNSLFRGLHFFTSKIRLFTSKSRIAPARNYRTYLTLTMVAAAETLLMA